MKRDPITTSASSSLGDAQNLMRRHNIRHLPVVEGDRLCGVLSERDILAFRAHADPDDDWWQSPISQAMTVPPQTAGPDDSLTEAAGRMASSRIGALPIIERGVLVGLVTATDVLEAEFQAAMH